MSAINVLLPLALSIIMFALGLGLTLSDFTRVALYPKAFAVGAFAQLVVLPVTAFLVVTLFALPPELALGLVILSLCPGGPTSGIFTKIGQGDVALSISLTAVITFVSVFTIPIVGAFFARHFLGLGATNIDIGAVAIKMVLITLLPALIGMFLRFSFPNFVTAIDKKVGAVALLLLTGLIGTSLWLNWASFIGSIGALFAACILILITMLAAGLLLGKLFGLGAASTTAISVDTAMQNGAMGIIISSLILNQTNTVSLVSVPSGVYGILMYFVCVPFVLWRRKTALS